VTEAFKWFILIGGFLVATGSRRWAMPVFVFMIPLMQWLPEIPVSGVNAMNLLLLPVLGRAIAAGRASDGKPDSDPLWFPLLIVGFLFFVSYMKTVTATDLPPGFYNGNGPYNAMVTFKEVVVDVLVYFCARRLTRSPDEMRLVFGAAVAGYLFEAVTAFREFAFGHAYRTTAHLGQPNKLGDFLAGYMMIPAGFLLSSTGKTYRRSMIGVVVTVLGLLGPLSRGALLAAGGGTTVIALVRRSKWLVVIVVLALTATMWLPDKFVARFEAGIEEDASGGMELNTKTEGRFMLWQAGMRMIRENPLGVGLEQYRWHLRDYDYEGKYLKSAHNIYMQLACEQGVLATLAHVWFNVGLALIGLSLAGAKRDTFTSGYGLAMLGMVVSFMAGSFFGDGFYENNLSGLFWVLAAMAVNLRNGWGLAEPDRVRPGALAAERET